MTLDHGSAERRFSLPTGYRLLNDLSSLKRPQRKNNLVTREGASSVRVRHVPILLEVDEDKEEKEEVRKGNMTSAPMILQQTNGSSQKSSLRPPRFSLPSPSVTESAKAKYLVREEKEGCGNCPLHGRTALRKSSISNNKSSTSSSLANGNSTSSGNGKHSSSVSRHSTNSNGHTSMMSGFGRPSSLFLGSSRPSNLLVNGVASTSPSTSSQTPSLYTRFSSPTVHMVPAPATPSVRRKSSKEKPAPPPPTSRAPPTLRETQSLRRKHSAPQPPTSPLEAPELIRRNSIGGNPTRHRPPLPAEWSQDNDGNSPQQQDFVRGGGDRRSLRGRHGSPPSHLNPTFSSLSRTHTVIPLLPQSLPSYFRPATLAPSAHEEVDEETDCWGDVNAGRPEPTISRASPSPSLQSILKSPGKRRPSQNHRVGFLDSLGKEIQQSRQF